MMGERLEVWTIGHSTRSATEFLDLLAESRIEAVADVRRFPASRKYPHFNQQPLLDLLDEAGIEYSAIPELGGRRRPRKDSPNTVWRSESFRGYADHMGTDEFQRGIEDLTRLARRKRTAIMCSEAVWWRCHRALIADHLRSLGAIVRHIVGPGIPKIHPYTTAARLTDGKLSYSPDGELPGEVE